MSPPQIGAAHGRYTHSEPRMNVGKHQNRLAKEEMEAERQAESFLMPETREAVTGR